MDRNRHDSQFIEDQLLTCVDCGSDFTFTGGEARFYLSKGLTIPPHRCPECRRRRKLTINREGPGHSFDDAMPQANKEIYKW
jgi:hypothetical protein